MSDISQSSSLREIFESQISRLPDKVALCLSAGIDSIALFSLLLDSKRTVSVYSFAFDESSHDFRVAKKLANEANCSFTPVFLPTDLDTLKQDILTLHEKYKCIKKTDYECVWPFLYVYPKIKESVIVTGLGAEGHFGTTRKGSIHYKDNLDAFRALFFANDNVSQKNQHNLLCSEFNLNPWFPFLTQDVRDWFSGKTWDEVNKPKAKQPILDMIKFDIIPKSSNLQCGSGIREHFDKLLNTSWNKHNYKSIVGIFNDINKGVRFNEMRKLI